MLLCPWNSLGSNTGVGWHPSPEDLPDAEIEPWSPAMQADSLLSEPTGKSVQPEHWHYFPNPIYP